MSWDHASTEYSATGPEQKSYFLSPGSQTTSLPMSFSVNSIPPCTQLPRPKSWGAVFYLFFTYHPIYHQILWALPSIYSFSKCFSTAATVTVLAQDKLFWAVSHRGSTSGTLLLSSCPFPSTPALVSTAPSSWNDAPNSSVGSKPPASSHLTSTMVFKLLSGCWLRL